MNKLHITLIFIFSFSSALPQVGIDSVLAEIDKNNTTLIAYRKNTDADKIGNKTGITPQNPEVEFNYLFGNPSAIGNRTDFRIKQSFDFPTAYSYKTHISDLKNKQAELEYKKQRNEILYQTRVLCVKLTFHNALQVELNKRYANARKIADAYKTKYNTGEVNILDFNKAQVNLLNISKERESNQIERDALLSELATLNGGIPIKFTDSLFSLQTIPADFEQWYAKTEASNPFIQWLKQEIVISEKQVKLKRAMSLPKLHGGFMSEKIVGEQFQGVTVGLSIPLWENKNSVKYAKAQSIAMQSVEADAKLQFYSHMKATHTKVIALQNNVVDFRGKLAMYSNSELLEKTFNKGEISLTEYMYELSLYYESIDKLREMEMNLNLAFAKMNRYQ